MNDPKPTPASPPSPRAFRRRHFRAFLFLALASSLSAAHAAVQQDTPPQQSPAPIVRVHPRPQSPNPQNAPADAAPLVARPPRPRPVNPQSLSVTPATTGQTTATTTPHPHAAQTTPSPAATGQTSPPKTPHTATPVTSTASTETKPTETKPAAPPKLSTTLNRNIIVLDPAHGGADSGSRIGDNLLEKNITLALAFRLRTLLTARGFTVVLTRDSDAATQQATPNSAPTPLTFDDRAGIANHARAAACLLLHATGRGNGVHLYSSELDPAPFEVTTLPWLTAQAAWVPASQQLERNLATALGRSRIALVSSAASVRPVDSLTCPALVLELAPQDSDPRSVNDAAYQEGVAQAIAGALVFWQNQVQPPTKLLATMPSPHRPRHHTPPLTTAPQEPQP